MSRESLSHGHAPAVPKRAASWCLTRRGRPNIQKMSASIQRSGRWCFMNAETFAVIPIRYRVRGRAAVTARRIVRDAFSGEIENLSAVTVVLANARSASA